MLKKVFSLLLIFAMFECFVYAHSGGTDSSGGHYNRTTGEYHYHGTPGGGHDDSDYDPSRAGSDEDDMSILDWVFLIIIAFLCLLHRSRRSPRQYYNLL